MFGDTIHAVASPPGSAPRAIVRLSGPDSRAAVAAVFAPAPPAARATIEGMVRVRGRALPAMCLWLPGPHSYTGEDTAELHLAGSAVLAAELQRAMVAAVGPTLRPARPGEFTARAFHSGRIDLLQAEGVLLLIHAADVGAAAAAAAMLGGGLSAAVQRARGGLQDALAVVEVGLDFGDEDTGAIDAGAWWGPLQRAAAELDTLARALPAAVPGGEVLLLGATNAGKSSLCNALAGREAVLVDSAPGTTRDLVRVALDGDVALWDAPGDLRQPGDVDRRALELRDRLGAQAAAALVVVDPGEGAVWPAATALPVLALVLTRAEQYGPAAAAPIDARATRRRLGLVDAIPHFWVDAATGAGVAPLRAFLQQRARAGTRGAGAPVAAAVARARAALQRLDPALAPELASVELQAALAALGDIDGHHGPEDLLDRIYGRFCLGK